MTEKLGHELDQVKIKQTSPIRFRDEAINKIRKQNIDFKGKSYVFVPFDVSKDSHQKGLKLRVYKGRSKDTHTKKVFYIQFWFNGKACRYSLGHYSQTFGVKECDEALRKVYLDHTDPETGFWIKDPNITKTNEKRIVEQPDTTAAKGYTVNEVIEAYCGAALPGETTERGFSKDRRDGFRAAKHSREWFRCMAGYNHRISLIKFRDDDDGYGYAEFLPNKHLRVSKPRDMTDLFRKYPPGKGILQDRVYYNRRKKQTYTIPKSQNYSIYDSYIGKSLIHKLTPGDVEHFIRGLSSMLVKKSYVSVFASLWIFARKRGWLGTNPGDCPFYNDGVYVKKEKQGTDPYKSVAMESPEEFQLFWECTEELSKQFPFKAELHQFMILTAMRKTEALKMKKEYINFDKGTLFIPKGVGKTRYRDEELPITPELEIMLRNLLDISSDPEKKVQHYKMIPWLFGTRKWSFEKYWDKKFRESQDARLGGDENFVPALRDLMRRKSGDPNLVFSPKILRKSYITLSQQQYQGRSEITAQMSRHASIDTLNRHYNKPSIETKKQYASGVSKVFKFIQRRSA
jgi:integrase|tara:strand:- start:781 stop:2493 length:1713 start_codon:yes stop_codon:yes gene_type:complete